MDLNFNNIHKFTFDDLNILIDINTGILHVIDETTFDLLDKVEGLGSFEAAQDSLKNKYTESELTESTTELQDLISKGMLFTPEKEILEYKPTSNPIVKALCLHIAHDCNLRCTYCFAGQGPYGGDRSLMSEEVGKKSIDFLLQASGPRKHVEIDFFGGEPLLNLDVVKKLVEYGKEKAAEAGKQMKFTITSNCVLLTDDVQKYLNDNDISCVLSIDGRKEINDKMRPFAGGQGSYDIIKDKIVNFTKSRQGKEFFVRGTFTRNNLDFVEDVKHLVEEGIDILSLEPVVSDENVDYAFKEEDIPTLKEEYEKLTRYYLDCYEKGKGFNFFHFNVDLNQGPCLPKRLSGCGAGHEYLAVSPTGDLYPCHQFVEREEFKVGHVDTGVTRPEIGKEFQNAHVLNKPECRECWARFYCSGGCHNNNLQFRESLLKPYKTTCELQKKRTECALYLQVTKYLNNNV
ncbi:uncharacterized protein SAMN00017405_1759 [Desulfonispora thiosulfatigenes DSM 11270]|uniref:Radical SAM core domain-containing protein n=1 Tax=Desulfonispora thiosulfatigenes DSM 11270 TaxID=656914 RepID=A0A1W1V3Y7_DESTI|nr:thioether cross-link-forming SCIFF peptide maturase [Desulfonispora thiosulfatigenes]SMB87764.1 uncharacterized protein SAMN00017405_1759 [Desulfonispora thiosulfatigenes DSM 11270]